jgi:hypothetical protein
VGIIDTRNGIVTVVAGRRQPSFSLQASKRSVKQPCLCSIEEIKKKKEDKSKAVSWLGKRINGGDTRELGEERSCYWLSESRKNRAIAETKLQEKQEQQ